MKRKLIHFAILPALALMLAGCTLRQAVARSSAAVLDDMIAALNAEPDPGHAREATASLLVMIEGFVRADPGNARLRRSAAQAYGDFLDGGKSITFSVPSQEGPVVSALRLDNRLLVRRTDFTAQTAPVSLPVGNRTVQIPRLENQCQIITLN